MKVTDFIFQFKTPSAFCSVGICRVRVFVNSQNKAYVLLSELDENPSTSVTNAIESIVAQLQAQQKIPSHAQIIEHYPSKKCFSETFDVVSFSPFGDPFWHATSKSEIIKSLECSDKEFNSYSEDTCIQKEIDFAINEIQKINRYEYKESQEVTKRRLEIESKMYNFQKIEKFLNTHPTESALAEFLKQDMSLFAEIYANPKDEYICFAEFPVGNGRVDFALFTGRSRMDVYLIEIKGAQENLRRKNYYGEFRSNVQEGLGQLIKRKDWCEHHYEKFRTFAYDVLCGITTGGKRPYQAFLGPKYQLEVDPQKDIKLHYILIAGRTSNNVSDSQKRHMEEKSHNFHVEIETWDSWIHKLSRM